jgi:hypothetical protein
VHQGPRNIFTWLCFRITVLLLTNGDYMNGTMSNNTINEISILRGLKKMTICELEELSSKIQEFLHSQDGGTIKKSETRKADIQLQEINDSVGVKNLTSNELEQLRLKVPEILTSHDMKFIKNMKPSRPREHCM